MTEWKRIREPVKTALILLLSISAVYLAVRSGVFTSLLPDRGNGSPGITVTEHLSYHAAAYPTEAAVSWKSGLTYGLKYDGDALEALYEELSSQLGEAIGSAEEPRAISREEWLALLDEAGVYLDYDCDLPIAAIAAWLGVEAPWKGDLRTLILTRGESEGVLLSFRAGEDGYFQSRTAASWASISERLNAYLPNGACFARRWDTLSDSAPDMLILETLPALHEVIAADAQTAAAEVLAEKTGINLNSQSCYTEADGTVVYPGDSGVLRLCPDGSLSFSLSAEYTLAEGDSIAEILERSRLLLEALHTPAAGCEVLRCDACRLDEEMSGEITFSCFCEGLPVLNTAGSAACLIWDQGRLTELTYLPRTYQLTEKRVGLLPEKQAAAAAGSRKVGGEAGICLYDSGDECLKPFWRVK